MFRFSYVKHFLLFILLVFQIETFAQTKCERLFQAETVVLSNSITNVGAQFLHEKDSKLHISASVERAMAKYKRIYKVSSTKPTDKIYIWLYFLERLSKKAESSLNTFTQIKTLLHTQFILKFDEIPQSYYDFQAKLALERGHGDVVFSAEQKKQLADILIKDQINSLDSWIEYLVSKDSAMYPMWLKYWMFTGMTKISKYDPQTGKFGYRDKGTVAPFAELNREALGFVADYVLNYLNKKNLEDIQDPEIAKLLQNLNFGKLYGHILFKLNVGKDGTFKSNEGQWVVYKKGSDHRPLVKSLEGHNTGWCTAGESTAESQLKKGDFHVFYSLDSDGHYTHPRVAIRMEGEDIAEVRGVAANQNLDPQINQSTVVSSKMKEFGSKADKFKKRDHDMKLLTQIEVKQNTKISLDKEDLKFLWEIENKIEGFGYNQDPRIEKIRAQRDLKSDLVEIFDYKYSREEITTTTKEFIEANGTSKVHIGDLYFSGLTTAENLKLPDILKGNLYLNNLTSARGLKLPATLNGNLFLGGLISAEGLMLPTTLNGSLQLSGLTTPKGLKLPDTLNGSLVLNKLITARGLKLPKTLNGNLYLSGLTTSEGLKLPNTLNGNLELSSLTRAIGLKLPDNLNGHLDLSKLVTAEGLKFPKTLNGDLDLSALTTTGGLTLPTILNGNLDLSRLTSAMGLKIPDNLNGSLKLNRLTTANGLKLPDFMNGDLYLGHLTTAEGLNLPRIINGNLVLRSITTTIGLMLPETINGYLDLSGLATAESLKRPQNLKHYWGPNDFTSN